VDVERPGLFVAGAVVSGVAVWFGVMLIVALATSDAGFVVWVVNLSVPACIGIAGAMMIQSGRHAKAVHPGRPIARRRGCLGSVVGGIAFFILCFSIIPEGEGQLGCLLFPFVGALVGAGVGIAIGAVADRARRQRPR
jgi:hypothetical protein